MKNNSQLDFETIEQLAILRSEPVRDAEQAAASRRAFLLQAKAIATVSPEPKARQTGWIQTLQAFWFARKERTPMFATLTSIILILSLVLGGGGITVAAAQSSLPDQALYPLKLWSEQARQGLTNAPEQQMHLALAFANRRMEEMQRMVQAGSVPPEALQTRYQEQIEHALQLALGMPDEQAIPALVQVRERLQNHERIMQQIQPGGDTPAEPVLARVRQMIRERLQWLEEDPTDPLKAREQYQQRYQRPEQAPGGPPEEAPNGPSYGPGPGQSEGDCPGCTPEGSGQVGNPWTTGTPTPGSGYGDGAGGNPWTTGTPTPGSGYGPGPGPDPTQTGAPEDGYGPGPQPTDQPGQPTQAGPHSPDPQPTDPPGNGGKP